MNIRPATVEDRAAIIELLKQSLGESTIPKSESLWQWKHEQNPFGPSFTLLAEENNTLIGLRAFMQWNWQWRGDLFKAIRAVDTATHPQHQGKGIFKKLTLQQLALCKDDGVHFVFNTPNEQSKPGYLKMGWIEQGKMPLKLKIRQPISVIYSKFFNKQPVNVAEDPTPFQLWSKDVCDLASSSVATDEKLCTNLTSEYIDWRYATNPLFRYNYFTDHENFLLISRVKKYPFAKEFRISEFILLNQKASPKTVGKLIAKEVRKFCKEHQIQIISMSGQQYKLYKAYFNWMGIIPVKPLGPIVTLRDLNMNDQFSSLSNQDNWAYSLGDMELF